MKTLRIPSPDEFVRHYIQRSPVAAAMGDADDAVLAALVREVGAALQPYRAEGSLALPMESHLAQAVAGERAPADYAV